MSKPSHAIGYRSQRLIYKFSVHIVLSTSKHPMTICSIKEILWIIFVTKFVILVIVIHI